MLFGYVLWMSGAVAQDRVGDESGSAVHRLAEARAAVHRELKSKGYLRILRELRDARWAMTRPHREAELRRELAKLWFDGVDGAGNVLTSRVAIREAIFQRWLHTATGVVGARTRSIVDEFVDRVVQPSEPFSAAELADILARLPDDREVPPWARP